MASKLKFKNQITDSLTDAYEIIKTVGRGIEKGQIDPHSAMSNLAESLRKLEAKYEKLKFIKTQTQNEDFGMCLKCKNEIPLGRIMIIPESRFCVKCV